MKRIALFLFTNILILATISITFSLLGIQPYITAAGLNYESLMIFCLIWGMGGAFISLAISRMVAKWMMKIKVIDPQSPGQYTDLVHEVREVSKKAGLPALPEIGIYDSPDINAFATGPTKKRSLVAFSTGLLNSMNPEQVRGVIAHELAHIKNGDMVTMTLVQGVINAIVMFVSRVVAYAASQALGKSQSSQMWIRIGVTIALDILLSILASFLVRWFSRQREYKADAGAAKYVGKEPMIAALEGLRKVFGRDIEVSEPAALATMKISSSKQSWFDKISSTHPSLEDRIARLQAL